VREELHKISLSRLQQEGKKYGVQLSTEDNGRWIDAIIDTLVRNNLPLQINNEEVRKENPQDSNSTTREKVRAPDLSFFDINILEEDSPSSQTQSFIIKQMKLQGTALKQIMEQQLQLQQMFMTLSTKDEFKTVIPASQSRAKQSHTDLGLTQGQHSVLLASQQGSKPSLLVRSRLDAATTSSSHQRSMPSQPAGQSQPIAPSTSQQWSRRARSPLADLHMMQNQNQSFLHNHNPTHEELKHPVYMGAPWLERSNRDYKTPISGIGHAVKFPSSIASCGGTEEENVTVWLEKNRVYCEKLQPFTNSKVVSGHQQAEQNGSLLVRPQHKRCLRRGPPSKQPSLKDSKKEWHFKR